jgi:hypothetical protein
LAGPARAEFEWRAGHAAKARARVHEVFVLEQALSIAGTVDVCGTSLPADRIDARQTRGTREREIIALERGRWVFARLAGLARTGRQTEVSVVARCNTVAAIGEIRVPEIELVARLGPFDKALALARQANRVAARPALTHLSSAARVGRRTRNVGPGAHEETQTAGRALLILIAALDARRGRWTCIVLVEAVESIGHRKALHAEFTYLRALALGWYADLARTHFIGCTLDGTFARRHTDTLLTRETGATLWITLGLTAAVAPKQSRGDEKKSNDEASVHESP